MAERKSKAFPENAPGDFYVADQECTCCGAPAAVAPDLIRHHDPHTEGDSYEHCYFRKQPETAYELIQAVGACAASCVGALRYAGTDPEIQCALRDAGAESSMDNPLPERFRRIRSFLRLLARRRPY